MPRGFDTASNCTAIAAAIHANNYDFVCRYYSDSLSKRLTASEAAALSAAGVTMVTVWEDSPTSDGYFSHLRGVDDGSSAYHAAMLLGQPAATAIYFAVDYDADPAVINGAITSYFQGIADGFTACAGGGAARYAVGIYGSGAACQAILGAGLANYSWLAGARAWRGSAGFNGWNLRQNAGTTLLGMGVDLDDATDDYGGFRV